MNPRWSLAVPLLFIPLALWLSDFPRVFQFDSDEGGSLMAALLHSRGAALYREVWMDQPPLFQLLLSALFRATGPSVTAARSLVLVLSGLLLWSLHRVTARTLNSWAAAFAVVALALTSYYARLSVSAMRGLPAIALAMLSIHALVHYQSTRRKRDLALSGLLFALALQTKIFVVLLGVPLGYMLVVSPRDGRNLPGSIWSGACILGWLLVALLTSIDPATLLAPHVAAREAAPGIFPGLDALADLAKADWDVLLLAAAVLAGWRQRPWRDLVVPGGALLVGIAVLATHHPVHYHYAPLLMLPACWVAAFGVQRLTAPGALDRWRRWKEAKGEAAISGLLAIGLLCFLVMIPFKIIRALEDFRTFTPIGQHREAMALVREHGTSGPGVQVITDAPIYPFRAGLSTDPALVTFSGKRLDGGMLKPEEVIAAIERQRPAIVLIQGRLSASHPDFYDRIFSYVSGRYVLKCKGPRVYLRNDLDH